LPVFFFFFSPFFFFSFRRKSHAVPSFFGSFLFFACGVFSRSFFRCYTIFFWSDKGDLVVCLPFSRRGRPSRLPRRRPWSSSFPPPDFFFLRSFTSCCPRLLVSLPVPWNFPPGNEATFFGIQALSDDFLFSRSMRLFFFFPPLESMESLSLSLPPLFEGFQRCRGGVLFFFFLFFW